MARTRTIASALSCVLSLVGPAACAGYDGTPSAQPPPAGGQPDAAQSDATAIPDQQQDTAADFALEIAAQDAQDGFGASDVFAPMDGTEPETLADASKAAACASSFGSELTHSFGRVDGTVVALVSTKDTQCALYNDDHVVVQILMHGKVYRMVASVKSSYGDPNVALLPIEAPLAGPAWAEGWHTDATLDYVSTLGVHASSFTPYPMDELEVLVSNEIELGSRISVFATSSGGNTAGSAHLIHRNHPNQDGAIVVRPDSAHPRYLLFRFANQVF
jgi:hypothetical protein